MLLFLEVCVCVLVFFLIFEGTCILVISLVEAFEVVIYWNINCNLGHKSLKLCRILQMSQKL